MAKKVIKRVKSLLSASQYLTKLNESYKNMESSDNYYSLVMELSNVYRNLKLCSATMCSGKTNMFYEKMRNKALDCEELCQSTFIVESNPEFDILDERYKDRSVFQIEKDEMLDFIVWFTRSRLLENHQDEEEELVDFNKLHLTNDCKLSCNIVNLLCDTLKIKCEIVKIPPAFTDEFQLYKGNGFHYFCLVTIDDVQYIVDATYRQFFTLDSNVIDRLGVMGMNGCNPGVYMVMNDSRLETALNILKKGYVVADEENLKNYFDGFALSYRNGLYYEWIGNADYSTSYSVQDYFSFLKEEELLFDYEPIEFLGEQKEPLNNCNFRFKN